MIPKLRKKFISLTAAALFVMILCVMVAINAIFIYQSNNMLDSRLSLMLRETGYSDALNIPGEANPREEKFQPDDRNPENTPPDLPDNSGGFFSKFGQSLRMDSDGCLIYLNPDGSLIEMRQYTAEEYSEDELLSIANTILQKGDSAGWHQYFKYRMVTRTIGQGTDEIVIGLINASSDLYSIFSMLFISALIGLLSFLLVLLVIIFASGKAVKPIAESYAKQKQFVTDAGHELKTPLTVISTNNELARMIYGDSEWFDSIDNQVAKMNGLAHGS